MSQKLFRKNVTFWSSLGASLEYYDFIIFTYLAPTLSMVFFDDSSHASLIKTYMISSIAYFARPLGSLLYGLIGDVRGRYKTFLGSLSKKY
jgi:MHS family proline/betaine transporter-like MFS transporter